jgi:hypothetical protein
VQAQTSKLLSVAIPTKNRQTYLKILVDELLLSKRDDFEVVIQDNSDSDALNSWINERNDSRLKYYYRPEWLSVVDNCDKLIENCAGEYICMLGDDDGIFLDEALRFLERMRLLGADAAMGRVLQYVWPDLSHPLFSEYGGKLYLKVAKGGSTHTTLYSTARRVVRRGGAMGLQDLPCVYHGFIAKKALERLHSLAGTYFPGPSPDMANAIGLCAVLQRVERTNQVLVITGHSNRSAGGAGTQRKHHGPIEEQAHLPQDTAEKWSPLIPYFWSGPTIYAQSVLSALARTRNNALGDSDLTCVYAACLVFHWEYRGMVWEAIMRNKQGKGKIFARVLGCSLLFVLKRGQILLTGVAARLYMAGGTSVNADSIADAIQVYRNAYCKS